jgi:transposase
MLMGRKKTPPNGQAIGKSRGGNTTKIHLVCEKTGKPVHFHLSGGQLHDGTMAENLLNEVDTAETERVLGDKGYDSDAIVEIIEELGAEAVIPSKSNRRHPRKLRKKTYRKRHRVENVFCTLKCFRSVATRYEKLALHYAGIVAMACIMMWLKN